MNSRTPLVIANWKLNGDADLICSSVLALTNPQFTAQVGIAAPFIYMGELIKLSQQSPLMIGAQNLSQFDSGAYTGETSASMLTYAGCQFALVGHSERRQYFAEDDAICNQKVIKAQAADLLPVLCIGETLEQYEDGSTKAVLKEQLTVALKDVDSSKAIVIAYEPVWAIGTGKSASAEEAQDIHQYIRAELVSLLGQASADATNILYGGSAKKDNAEELMSKADIDGLLVGGASLDPEHFAAICTIASNHS